MIIEVHSVQELIDTIEKLEFNYTYSRPIAPNVIQDMQSNVEKSWLSFRRKK